VDGATAWGASIVCGLVLWAGCAGVLAFGREVWPGEMPEAVRLAVAPAIAAAATVAARIAAPGVDALVRAASLTLIVAALDALLLSRTLGGAGGIVRARFGFWLPLAAIFVSSWLTGQFSPM